MALSDRIVVMNKGVIEQIGRPTEIYDTPKTRYVASFIGEMNFIPGENGTEIAVRPEDIRIGGEREDACGTIRTIMPLGHYTKVALETADGLMLRAYVPKMDVETLHLNDRASLMFQKQYVYDKNGGFMQ